MFKNVVTLVLVLLFVSTMPILAKEDNPLGKVKKVSEEKANALGQELLAEGSDIKKLLKKGANPNVILADAQNGNETPFMAMLTNGELETAKIMTYAGADVDYVTVKGNPLMVHYLNDEQVDIAIFLYTECKATTPDPTALFDGINFAGVAAAAGALEILQAEQEKGLDILQTFNIQKGDTIASYNLLTATVFVDEGKELTQGKRNVLNWLLEQNIDVNVPMKLGTVSGDALEAYAVTLAAMGNQLEIFNILVDAGADLNVTTLVKEGEMSMRFDLSIIPLMNENPAMLIELLKKGANPNGVVVMINGEEVIANIPAMVFAVNMNNLELIKILKEKGANLDAEVTASPMLGIPTSGSSVLECIINSDNDEIKALFEEELAASNIGEETTDIEAETEIN